MISLSSISDNYIESIIKENKDPEWLAALRQKALSKYLSLPSEVSPLYAKYSDVNRIRPEQIYLPNPVEKTVSHAKPHEELQHRLNELAREDTSIVQIGSSVNQIIVPEKILNQGVIISDLRESLLKYNDLIKNWLLANELQYSEDKFLALEAAAFRSGVFIYIPKNALLSDPIRIISSLADDGTSLISQNIIIADAGSKATVVQEIYSPLYNDRLEKREEGKARQDMQQAYFELVQCHLGQNAHLDMVTLQSMPGNTVDFSNRKAFIGRDAKMSWYLGLFGAQLSRYKIDSIMKEPGSTAEDFEIIFGIEEQSFDVTSNLIHYGPNSRGRVLVKSVMKDRSKSLFKGMIKIGKNAKASESYLAGHAILLDKGAKSDAIPGLEIETNEVKATHSASVAQLDEAQIFYLMSRGLSRELAKREIVSGFLEPLSRKMGPTIRAWVNYLIENKWSGKPLMLKTDEAMEQILEVEKSRYRETEDIFEKHYKYR
ncbi:MAG: SufD family Fe-S cluster assembly protein [Nitrososphaeraceae archaeon]|nr:SufD family Fe-S cluster assembly protein [Nitrososphaeraceae archaeon]MDW0331394.1 SufD family Fe-S cluster assembly protein [Nitrososphaeraceae archaeon]